jgi:anion-transporting  ArsA/GET3 family ATPase
LNGPVAADLLEKRLVVVTGKGGVGKTTVAIALGLRAAAEGKRTIVCEVSAQEHASRIFNRAEVGFHEVEMEENLWAISIDPDESMREYVLLQLKVRAMRDVLFRSRIFSYLAAATPGLKELVTIGKIWELAQLDRKVKRGRKYDLVVVDAPSTGQGVGFLQTPRDRLAPRRDARQRVRGAGGGAARGGRGRGGPDLHERALPRALQRGRGEAPGRRR